MRKGIGEDAERSEDGVWPHFVGRSFVEALNEGLSRSSTALAQSTAAQPPPQPAADAAELPDPFSVATVTIRSLTAALPPARHAPSTATVSGVTVSRFGRCSCHGWGSRSRRRAAVGDGAEGGA